MNREILTRRRFLGGMTGAAVAILTGCSAPPSATSEAKPTPRNTLNMQELRQKVLDTPIKTNERAAIELSFLDQLKTAEDINKGFWVLSDPDARSLLLEKRHYLRKSGDPNYPMIDVDQEYWALHYTEGNLNRGIHPEVLASCIDAYPKAHAVITELRDQLRPNLVNAPIATDDLMINPGGMARLVCYETGWGGYNRNLWYGFGFIGSGRISEELNQSTFPDGLKQDKKYLESVNEMTGLTFKSDSMPVSKNQKASVADSGGARGLQFMPETALFVDNLMRQAGLRFNTFDIESSLIGAWVYLAHGIFEQTDEGFKIIRYGYRRGDQEAISFALQKWNQHPDQVSKITAAAESYWDKFIKTN